MRLIIQPDYQSVSQWAAHYVAAKIKAANPTPEKPFVLGCPTGSSPLGMYKACRRNIPKAIILLCGTTFSATLTSNRKIPIS